MRIAIDCREAFRAESTGKGKWTEGFLKELMTRNADVTLCSDTPVPKQFDHLKKIIIPKKGFAWHWSLTKELKRRSDIDIFLSPTSYIVPALLGKRKRCIPVVHDLIAFRNEPHDRKARMIEYATLGRAIRTAWKVAVISESTKKDLMERHPRLDAEKIFILYAGPLRESVPASVPDEKTILCAATLCPRKNQARLIRAYAKLDDELRKQYRLVLVGARGWHDEEIIQLIEKTPGVEWKKYVSDTEYEALLNRATVFAMPSLYEGFGMQILDAMQRSIPILTSNKGSLKEVAGFAALFCNPEDEQSIRIGLRMLLLDEELRKRLQRECTKQAAQFSWKRTVDLFLEALGNV